MSKSRRPVSTTTLPPGDGAAIMVTVPASKPRNRHAVDPLLRKSGAHQADDGKGGKKRARIAEQSLRDDLKALSGSARRRPLVQDDDH